MTSNAELTQALEGLVDRFGLPEGAVGRLQALLDLLGADAGAPTSVTDPRRALEAHLADSLVGLELPEVRAARRVADVGTGAGFPGLPLAIALPRAALTLVEGSQRKCSFLRRALAAVRVDNVSLACTRVEDWDAGRGTCDLVAARALAPLGVVVEWAAPLMAPAGHLVAWKGRRDPDAEAEALATARAVGLRPEAVVRVIPFPHARDRHLHVFVKVADTPERFPRRAGMARKRPLTAQSGDRG